MPRINHTLKTPKEVLTYQSVSFAYKNRNITANERNQIYKKLHFTTQTEDKLVSGFIHAFIDSKNKLIWSLENRKKLTTIQKHFLFSALNHWAMDLQLKPKDRNKLYTLVYYPSDNNIRLLASYINYYENFLKNIDL